mmetsp:Transcript_67827/g.107555  ORF Transcript_67827/g.107555 Transcript_67827/m.107555 type:complete len:744 (+) Transcript_67827:105-2336(+)
MIACGLSGTTSNTSHEGLDVEVDAATYQNSPPQNIAQLAQELAALKNATRDEIEKLQQRVMRLEADESSKVVEYKSSFYDPADLIRRPSSRRIDELESGSFDRVLSARPWTPTFGNDSSVASCSSSRPSKHGNLPLELPELLRVPSASVMDAFGDRIVDEYEFNASSWDIGVLAFTKFFTWRGSIALVMIYVLNLVVQGAFLFLTWKELAVPFVTKGTKDDVWLWRVTTAHDMKFIDPITDQSLARRICEDSDASSVSSMPSILEKQLRAYQSGWLGIVLCVMSMLIWWLTASIEIRDTCRMACGLFRLPPGKETMFEKTDIGYRIQNLTTSRKLWSLHICLSRFTIAATALYVGSNFLMFTINIEDLLLNAVALDLVINVDELIFAAIAPFKAAKLLPKLEPLPVASLRQKYACGFDLGGRMVMFGLLVMFVGWTTSLGLTVVQDVEEVYEGLCGYNLDFVYVMDPGGAFVTHKTPAHPPEVTETYRYQAIFQAITDLNAISQNVEMSLTDSAAGLYVSPLSLAERPKVSIGKRMAELNPQCVDNSGPLQGLSVWPADFTRILVKDALAGEGVSVNLCGDASEYCNADNLAGVRMRQWCPRTCGCHEPNSSLVLTSIDGGCPPPCRYETSFSDYIKQAPCVDAKANSTAFGTYISGLQSLQWSYRNNVVWYPKIGLWIQQLLEYGCKGHSLGPFGDLCGDNVFKLKPFTLLCPETCGCPMQQAEGHPRLCLDSCLRNGTPGF